MQGQQPPPSLAGYVARRKPPRNTSTELIKIIVGGVVGIGLAAIVVSAIKSSRPDTTARKTPTPATQPRKPVRVAEQNNADSRATESPATEPPVATTVEDVASIEPVQPKATNQGQSTRRGDAPRALGGGFIPDGSAPPLGVSTPESAATESPVGIEELGSRLLTSPDPKVRFESARSIRVMGQHGAPAIGALVAAAEDVSPDVRLEAMAALTELGSQASEAVPKLARIASKDGLDEDTRTMAVLGVLAIDRESQEARKLFTPLITHRSPIIQLRVCRAIARLEPTPSWAESPLRDTLKESAKEIGDRLEIFIACAAALGNLPEPSSQTVAALKKFAEAKDASHAANQAKLAADTAYRTLTQRTSSAPKSP